MVNIKHILDFSESVLEFLFLRQYNFFRFFYKMLEFPF